MLDPARVDVHREPVGGFLRIDGRRVGMDGLLCLVVRAQIGVLVPRRAHEGVHGVRFAGGWSATPGTGRVQKPLVELERALARRPELGILGQKDRQVLVGHGHYAAVITVNDGNRRAPHPLPADEPVVQAVVDLELAFALPLQPVGDLLFGHVTGRAAEFVGVDHRAVLVVKEHVPVEWPAPQHFHHGAILACTLFQCLATGYDGPVRTF